MRMILRTMPACFMVIPDVWQGVAELPRWQAG